MDCSELTRRLTLLAAFFYFLLPEMKGRSLEEIDEMFEKRVRVKYFATYECDCSAGTRRLVPFTSTEEVKPYASQDV